MTKVWYPVKIQFLSFTCEDITVVMATLVSANKKRALQHLAIGVYIVTDYYMPACGSEFYLLVFNSISHSFARCRVEHEKIKFVSTRGRVISSVYLANKPIFNCEYVILSTLI